MARVAVVGATASRAATAPPGRSPGRRVTGQPGGGRGANGREALIRQVAAELAAARGAARAVLAAAHDRGRLAEQALQASRSAEARTVPELEARRSAAMAQLDRRLAGQPVPRAQRDCQARTIEASYLDGCARVGRAVHDAAAEVGAAAAAARAAAGLVTGADANAGRLWRDLARLAGRRGAARLGPLPTPSVQAAGTDPAVPLTRAADLLAAADTAARRALIPATAALLGAVCAAAVALSATALSATYGRSLVATILAWTMIFAAPCAGLPMARSRTREGLPARRASGAVATTVAAGALASFAIVALVS